MKLSALDPLRDESTATGAKIGKGLIGHARPERVNLEALARLLQATAADDDVSLTGADPAGEESQRGWNQV